MLLPVGLWILLTTLSVAVPLIVLGTLLRILAGA